MIKKAACPQDINVHVFLAIEHARTSRYAQRTGLRRLKCEQEITLKKQLVLWEMYGTYDRGTDSARAQAIK